MENCEQKLIEFKGKNKEKIDKEEVVLLRHELEKVKEKIREGYEQDKKAVFFQGLELFYVNVNELTDDDLLVYKNLKDFKRQKISFEDMFCRLSQQKISVGEHVTAMLEKDKDFDFIKDSRAAFLAWMGNKLIDEYYEQRVRARKKKTA